ncbi:MAG: hypothetical protein Q7R35_11120 [Elusimicrobiota bacterium]|nr:hypothetical protein [Elusimicrobiota bacterium]
MRFIHTSDWHLGKLLFENRLVGDQAAAFKEGVAAAEKGQGEEE